jgi:hypothetical protein
MLFATCPRLASGVLVVLSVSFFSTNTEAQMSARRPGLWEIKTKSLVDGKAPERALSFDKLSKEEQAKVQEAMADRGMKLISDGPKGRVLHVCLTQPLAQKEPELFGSVMRKQGCTTTLKGRKNEGKTAMYDFTCKGAITGAGSGEMTLSSPQAYKGFTQVVQLESGKPDKTIRQEVDARWLKDDCGKLKARPRDAKGETK